MAVAVAAAGAVPAGGTRQRAKRQLRRKYGVRVPDGGRRCRNSVALLASDGPMPGRGLEMTLVRTDTPRSGGRASAHVDGGSRISASSMTAVAGRLAGGVYDSVDMKVGISDGHAGSRNHRGMAQPAVAISHMGRWRWCPVAGVALGL